MVELHLSNNTKIHIANHTGQDIHVLTVPNADWLKVDLASTLLQTALFPPAFIGGIRSAKDFVNLLRSLFKFGKTAYSLISKPRAINEASEKTEVTKQIEAAKALFAKDGRKIAPQQAMLVNEKALGDAVLGISKYLAMLSPLTAVEPVLTSQQIESMSLSDLWEQTKSAANLLSPSTFMSMLGAVADVTVIVASADFQQIASFDANSDHSWIVKEDRIVRQKYGAGLHEENPDAGWHWFKRSLGPALSGANNEYLEPDQCLALNIGGGQMVLLYQQDGNLVLYDDTTGSRPNAVWATNTAGQKAWRAIMQNDGNFVLYSEPGRPVWALWKEMPEGHEKCIVGLYPDYRRDAAFVARVAWHALGHNLFGTASANAGSLGYFKDELLFKVSERGQKLV